MITEIFRAKKLFKVNWEGNIMDIKEVENKLESLNYSEKTNKKIRNSGAFTFLPKYLLSNEKVYYIGLSSLPSEAVTAMIFSDVLLVITEKRLLLLAKRVVGVQCKEFLYSRINSIENLGLGKHSDIIRLKTSSGDITFGVGRDIDTVINLIYDGINGLLGNKENKIDKNNTYHDESVYLDKGEENCDFIVSQVFNADEGIVLTGIVLNNISVGNSVVILDNSGNIVTTSVVLGIELNRRLLYVAKRGDDVGLFFKGLSYDEIKRGYRLVINNEIYKDFDMGINNEIYKDVDMGIINIEASFEVPAGIIVVGVFLDNVLVEDKVAIYDDNNDLVAISKVIGLEKDRQLVNRARIGDYAGILLEKISCNIKSGYRLEII